MTSFIKRIGASAILAAMATVGTAASAATVYQASTSVVGGLCPTCAGTASAFGDDITLAGGAARLTNLTWDTSNFGADYDAQIQVRFFDVAMDGGLPALGAELYSQTTSHFLSGGHGSSSRSFVDIALGGFMAPARFIYSIGILNNNGVTNWNVSGQITDEADEEDESLAQAVIGTNNETDFVFTDYTTERDAGTLDFRRQGMNVFQLGLPGNEGSAMFSNFTPNVTFTAAEAGVSPVPLPAGLPLLLAGLGAFGVLRKRRKA